jgi:hypothetical protein
MAHINWTIEVPIDPVTLSPAPGGIPIPTYGNYGGPGYSNGSVGGTITIGAHAPVDNLDTLFFYHDLAYQQQPLSKEIPSADLALIHGIELLTAAGQLDAEASLYAGAAILAVISSMAVNGNLPAPSELLTADATAVHDIQHGLSHLTPTERGPHRWRMRSAAASTPWSMPARLWDWPLRSVTRMAAPALLRLLVPRGSERRCHRELDRHCRRAC